MSSAAGAERGWRRSTISLARRVDKKKTCPSVCQSKTNTQGCSARDWARIYVHVRKPREQHTLVAHTHSHSSLFHTACRRSARISSARRRRDLKINQFMTKMMMWYFCASPRTHRARRVWKQMAAGGAACAARVGGFIAFIFYCWGRRKIKRSVVMGLFPLFFARASIKIHYRGEIGCFDVMWKNLLPLKNQYVWCASNLTFMHFVGCNAMFDAQVAYLPLSPFLIWVLAEKLLLLLDTL